MGRVSSNSLRGLLSPYTATNPQPSGEIFLEKLNQAHGSKWYQVQRPQVNHREAESGSLERGMSRHLERCVDMLPTMKRLKVARERQQLE